MKKNRQTYILCFIMHVNNMLQFKSKYLKSFLLNIKCKKYLYMEILGRTCAECILLTCGMIQVERVP
jgi:hypothetical protein